MDHTGERRDCLRPAEALGLRITGASSLGPGWCQPDPITPVLGKDCLSLTTGFLSDSHVSTLPSFESTISSFALAARKLSVQGSSQLLKVPQPLISATVVFSWCRLPSLVVILAIPCPMLRDCSNSSGNQFGCGLETSKGIHIRITPVNILPA